MENEELKIINSEIDTDITENEEDSVNESDNDSEIEELKKKIKTLEFQKDHWKNKAESKTEVVKTEVKTSNKSLSDLDIIAISKANIDEEDIPEVLEYAKFKKISVAEALKSSIIKSTLSDKTEFRKAQEASNIGNVRRGISKVDDSTLLDNARKGILPKETDDEAIKRLAKLR